MARPDHREARKSEQPECPDVPDFHSVDTTHVQMHARTRVSVLVITSLQARAGLGLSPRPSPGLHQSKQHKDRSNYMGGRESFCRGKKEKWPQEKRSRGEMAKWDQCDSCSLSSLMGSSKGPHYCTSSLSPLNMRLRQAAKMLSLLHIPVSTPLQYECTAPPMRWCPAPPANLDTLYDVLGPKECSSHRAPAGV